MPGTRRKLIARPRYSHFSEEAVRLFALIVNREAAGLAPGSREHNALAVQLQRALGRRVWEPHVLDVSCEGAEPWPASLDEDTPGNLEARRPWIEAAELRRELEAAILPADSEDAMTGPSERVHPS
jgi:hypothetical protein